MARRSRSLTPALGPWWLERQRDPASPAYVVGNGEQLNSVGRSWTLLGTLDGSWRPAVDPAGLLSVGRGRPSVDWWVKAADRWVFPSRHTAVRQRAVDGTPVVETRLRVAGGDVIQRVGLARTAEDVAVLEITNETTVPVAVAVAVRPYDLLGPLTVDDRTRPLAWSDADFTLSAAGRPLLRSARAPGQVLFADTSTDLAADMESGRFEAGAEPAEADGDTTQAALVFPLVHTATLRLAVVDRPKPARSRLLRTRGAVSADIPHPPTLPNTTQLAAGWRTQGSRLRIDLPAGVVAEALDAVRTHLPLFRHDCWRWRDPYARVASGPAGPVVVMRTLTELGYGREVATELMALAEDVEADGHVGGTNDPTTATAGLVVAATDHWRLQRDGLVLEAMTRPVTGALHWLAQRRNRRAGGPDGLVASAVVANGWALRAFDDGAELLAAAGEEEAAQRARSVAAELRVDLQTALDGLGRRPPGATELQTGTAIEQLALAWPCRALRPEHPVVEAAVAAVVDHWLYEWGCHVHTPPRGWDVVATVRLAMVELGNGSTGAARIEELCRAASPTMTWPSRIHPRLGTGSAGGGHDGVASASVGTLLRNMIVGESSDGSRALNMLRRMPASWWGQAIEVHQAPTDVGRLSFAVRWHDERPAVLWELEPHVHDRPVRLSAPGLDPSWSTESPAGEALLAPTPPPAAALEPRAEPPAGPP